MALWLIVLVTGLVVCAASPPPWTAGVMTAMVGLVLLAGGISFDVPLWSVLLGVTVVGALMGSSISAKAAGVLLVNWIVGTILAKVTGNQFQPLALSVVDLVTGCLILSLPFSRYSALQVMLAASYVFSLGAHAFYLNFGPSDATDYFYWYAMHYIAWTQAAIVIGWTGGRIIEMARRGRYRGRRFLVWPSLLARKP